MSQSFTPEKKNKTKSFLKKLNNAFLKPGFFFFLNFCNFCRWPGSVHNQNGRLVSHYLQGTEDDITSSKVFDTCDHRFAFFLSISFLTMADLDNFINYWCSLSFFLSLTQKTPLSTKKKKTLGINTLPSKAAQRRERIS